MCGIYIFTLKNSYFHGKLEILSYEQGSSAWCAPPSFGQKMGHLPRCPPSSYGSWSLRYMIPSKCVPKNNEYG